MVDGPTEADGASAEAPAGGRVSSCLLFLSPGEGRAQLLELRRGETLVVGRGASADLRIEDSKVSREHARLRWSGDDVLVEDLGSRNGTQVGGTTISDARVRAPDGTQIVVGRARFVVSYVRDDDETAEANGNGPVIVDPEMRRVHALAGRLGPADTPVLLFGETGVGKDVIARAIHAHDPRNGPFVRFNCAATAPTLVESELFGHEKGAFTGADRRTIGFVESANGGTLFLDEVGELPLALQAKLLHVLENRVITRVGSTKEIPVDIRVLAATHRDLEAATQRGAFRSDLYYRVAVFKLDIPPLRSRRAEIPALARRFLAASCGRAHRPVPVLSDDALAVLHAHDWPGNVRELRNTIEHALVLADTRIEPAHLPAALVGRAPASSENTSTLSGELGQVEREIIVQALEAEGGNRTRAAKRLGISRRALQYKIGKYGLP